MTDTAGASFTLTIKESALNKLAQKIGSISDSGHRNVRISYPCYDFWEGEWKTCRTTVYSADWNWTISNVTFDIAPSGITYQGDLRASYGPFAYSTQVSGTGGLSVVGNSLRFTLSSINIPIEFDIPVVGNIRITTINSHLPYRFAVPFEGFAITTTPPEGQVTHPGIITDVSRQYLDGKLNITGEITFW
jgi:hypothetical protein